MSKILIVDDEKRIVEIIKYNLLKEKHETKEAYDGETALNMALEGDFDLILLDVMLPKMDGYDVCKRIRKKLSTPIIMLTAREQEIDKVLGLELGADDYITKPFSMPELMARIKANIRRIHLERPIAEDNDKVLKFGSLIIDCLRFEVSKNGKPVDTTLREFELLKFLAGNAETIFTRENLLEKVWGYEYYGDGRTVDVTIRRLREKIEDDPGNPNYVITKRGIGYYFKKQ